MISSGPATAALERTLAAARRALLAARTPAGHWEGELSPSALSTATAIVALELVRRAGGRDRSDLVRAGLLWLADHQNADGGFGDTPESPSNISTTTLCWAALSMGGQVDTFSRVEAWLKREVGDLSAPTLARAIEERYLEDRTFSVPILTMCALAGRFGEGPGAWAAIPRLPFELAALPSSWYSKLGLSVVSYALPALIAIGQAQLHHRPGWNPIPRMTRGRTLRILESIQPSSGGFLEATPLTSFVTMSLASCGHAEHPATRKAVAFLEAAARKDGSWAIDSDLATWVTTLSVQALGEPLPEAERRAVRDWILKQQFTSEHPYTHAAPGAWAWTDRSGGVPDADDTSGALLALLLLRDAGDADARRAAEAGVTWLLDLQNRDGGIPTFCRGWGKLPFDRSCPDLTAHALRAWAGWRLELPPPLRDRLEVAMRRAFAYLVSAQQADGSWVPLWFGNQRSPGLENPVYGTSRVLLASPLEPSPMEDRRVWAIAVFRAIAWLLSAQNPDGGFGGAAGIASTIEETALATEALCLARAQDAKRVLPAIARAAGWLAERTAEGTRFEPAPIGLYFAKLWYWERLYPLIFTVAALRRALS